MTPQPKSYTSDKARWKLGIVYQGYNGRVWVRPAADWHRSMKEVAP